MFDIRGILFWIFVFGVLYFLGPASIYLVGVLTLLCLLCSSCLSSFSTVKVIPVGGTGGTGGTGSLGDLGGLGDLNDIVRIMNYTPGQGVTTVTKTNVPTAVRVANVANMDRIGGVPRVARVPIPDGGVYVAQVGGYGNNGFDMTADQVYAAFADHPYPGEDLGYGYYDGYNYVL